MRLRDLDTGPVDLGRIDGWLRAIGLCIWLFFGIAGGLWRWPLPAASAWVWPWLLFGVAFGVEALHRHLPRVANVCLLGAQMALGLWLSAAGLQGFEGLTLAIVAAQVPTILSLRWSLVWAVTQLSLLAFTVSLHRTALHVFEACGAYSAFSAFALLTYWLQQREQLARRQLAAGHAQLVATRALVIDQTRQAERSRLTRELHDSLGHHLTSLSIQLQLAQKVAVGREGEVLLQAQAITATALKEVRRVVSGEQVDEGFDLVPALRALAAGIPAPVIHIAAPEPWAAPELGPALFRCIQEAVTNSLKHANAHTVRILLGQSEGEITATITDDGRGHPALSPGQGLQGMQHRMQEIGGSASFTTAADQGFVVRLRVPRPETAA